MKLYSQKWFAMSAALRALNAFSTRERHLPMSVADYNNLSSVLLTLTLSIPEGPLKEQVSTAWEAVYDEREKGRV